MRVRSAGDAGSGCILQAVAASSWWYRPPRISEATAAIRQAMIANANAACRPERNGREIRCGKKERPVRIAWLWADSALEHVRADQVLDRVVAEERGEQDRDRRHVAMRCAAAAETPCACRPAVSVCGRLPARPTIISEKKMPTDSTWARVLEGLVHPAAGAAVAAAAGCSSRRRGWATRTGPSRRRSAAAPAANTGRRSWSAAATAARS